MISVLKLHIPDEHMLTSFTEHLSTLSVAYNVIDSDVVYEYDSQRAESFYRDGEEWLFNQPDVTIEHVTDYGREQLWQY